MKTKSRLAHRAVVSALLAFVGQNLFQPERAEFGGDDGPLVGIRRSYYGKIAWTLE
ncbi:MAG TPA: hypothetical protein VJS43_17410 [Candidatus Acidoferrales bacterium]|nr:hypothetical protein [Candidatus Acidoferrales bacterium]